MFRNARPTDADRCFDIETSAYEGDEAATYEKILKFVGKKSEKDFVFKRPGQGIKPDQYQNFIGKKLIQKIKKDYMISSDLLE